MGRYGHAGLSEPSGLMGIGLTDGTGLIFANLLTEFCWHFRN